MRKRTRLSDPNAPQHSNMETVVFKTKWTEVAEINFPYIGTQLIHPRAQGASGQG